MNDAAPNGPASNVSESHRVPAMRLPVRHALLLWFLFFLICLGLGYPTLNRYDPAHTGGLTDSIVYQQMVVGSPGARVRAEIFGGRVLVPYTARVIYRLTGERLKTQNSVAFSMLVAGSLFCATTALLLVIVGQSVVAELSVALLAATLYLLTFAIPNLQLAGLIDSGEAMFMLALVWSLISRKWWLLALLGVGGALAKETFMPFAAIFAIVWWADSERRNGSKYTALGWIALMILLSTLTLVLIRLALFGHLLWPWQIAVAMNSGKRFLPALLRCVSDRSFWYVFVWLLPFGVWRLRSLPRPWLLSSAFAALAALGMGAYGEMGGTVARPVFNVVGPMLSLSVAILIARAGLRNVNSQHRGNS